MSKRKRGSDEDALRRAIEVICQRPATSAELAAAATLTPLERQVVALRESLPDDVILMVACGYRVKFYGRDSHVASRRFGIMCIPATPFEYSSVPLARVDLYVHRLVAMGYRVAFADQENASIRATSGNAKGLFTREISRVYSRGSLLPAESVAVCSAPVSSPADANDEVGDDDGANAEGPTVSLKGESSELVMCFVWAPPSSLDINGVTEITLLSFVTYSVERFRITSETELLDILHRYDIVEVVLFSLRNNGPCAEHSKPTALSCMTHLRESFASALNSVLALHFGPTINGEEDSKNVSLCVSPYVVSMDESIIKYLELYRLDKAFRKMCGFADHHGGPNHDAKNVRQVMELPGSTLDALHVFHSSLGLKGSMLALLDHTLTVPGSRRLRAWLAAPPCDVRTINMRLEAVSFMMNHEYGSAMTNMLRECSKFGDIEATLGKLQAQRCSIVEYIRLLQAVKTSHALSVVFMLSHDSVLPTFIRDTLSNIASEETSAFLGSRQRELKMEVMTALEYYMELGSPLPPSMEAHVRARDDALRALDDELERVRQVLRVSDLEYRTIAGTSFIIDVPQAMSDRVEEDWLVLTRTKTHVRFHTPAIVDLNVMLCSAKERLQMAANDAWLEMQQRLVTSTDTLRVFQSVIECIATIDALRCLATASSAPGYVAPVLTDGAEELEIIDGRHPVLNSLMPGGCVGSDVRLVKGGAWLLTGPNMGGKSALMRMVGVFVIMAQLGCYVPAKSARLPTFSAVYCRMGSSDSLLEGTSTFLKEMEETSRILRSDIVSSSIVLLDELGRGTSSFDGLAVAAATLEYLLSRKATTLFVTHYSQLCEPYANLTDDKSPVCCYYMGFREEKIGDGGNDEYNVVFTYKPTPGVSPSSFGVRVARLAGLPCRIVAEAQRLSEQTEREQKGLMSLLQMRRFVNTSPE
ncbi:MutS domain [Trypanosoma vivax]|nr:MutS domain [Trypanosoma vivax]